jgi:hypothetical protein
MIKFTITNDELVQRPGYTPNGKYDEIFAQLTPEQNCIVLEDAKDLNKVSGALIDYAKRRKIAGAKVKTTKAYHTDGKPACGWCSRQKSKLRSGETSRSLDLVAT